MEGSHLRLPANQTSLTTGNSLQLQVGKLQKIELQSSETSAIGIEIGVSIDILHPHVNISPSVKWRARPPTWLLLVALIPPVMDSHVASTLYIRMSLYLSSISISCSFGTGSFSKMSTSSVLGINFSGYTLYEGHRLCGCS